MGRHMLRGVEIPYVWGRYILTKESKMFAIMALHVVVLRFWQEVLRFFVFFFYKVKV